MHAHDGGRKKGEFDEDKEGYIQYEQYERVYECGREKPERNREKE